jgi:GDP-L-fucose synthase
VLYENLQIQNNIIGAAYSQGVEKLLFIASGTIYPFDCAQPILETSLFQGSLDPLHESNGLAKICGIKLCEKIQKQSGKEFFTLVPTNIYGI